MQEGSQTLITRKGWGLKLTLSHLVGIVSKETKEIVSKETNRVKMKIDKFAKITFWVKSCSIAFQRIVIL